jgi:hypothetical protein
MGAIAIDRDRLTRKQVCAILEIGSSTLGAWMRKGKIKFTKDADGGQWAKAYFRLDDIKQFIPAPPVAESATHPTALYTVKGLPYQDSPSGNLPERPSSGNLPEHKDKRTFAEKFLDGDATDSVGNTVHGANDLWPTTGATLIGPVTPYTPPPVNRDTTSHMDQNLVGRGGAGAGAGYLDSLERHRDIGNITAAQYDTLTGNAEKARRQCEQSKKEVLDRRAISEAFRHGYSR